MKWYVVGMLGSMDYFSLTECRQDYQGLQALGLQNEFPTQLIEGHLINEDVPRASNKLINVNPRPWRFWTSPLSQPTTPLESTKNHVDWPSGSILVCGRGFRLPKPHPQLPRTGFPQLVCAFFTTRYTFLLFTILRRNFNKSFSDNHETRKKDHKASGEDRQF